MFKRCHLLLMYSVLVLITVSIRYIFRKIKYQSHHALVRLAQVVQSWIFLLLKNYNIQGPVTLKSLEIRKKLSGTDFVGRFVSFIFENNHFLDTAHRFQDISKKQIGKLIFFVIEKVQSIGADNSKIIRDTNNLTGLILQSFFFKSNNFLVTAHRF